MIDDIINNPHEVWFDNDGYVIYIKFINGHWYWVITQNGEFKTAYNPNKVTAAMEREYIDQELNKKDSTGQPMQKKYP